MHNHFEAELKESKPVLRWKLAPFDVTSAYWSDSPEKPKAMLADPDWENIVVAGEKPWIDTERADCQIGWDNVYLEDGKIMNA